MKARSRLRFSCFPFLPSAIRSCLPRAGFSPAATPPEDESVNINVGVQNVAPLTGTNHRERLMVTGDLLAEDGSSRRLVTGEWDEAETWMIEFTDQ